MCALHIYIIFQMLSIPYQSASGPRKHSGGQWPPHAVRAPPNSIPQALSSIIMVILLAFLTASIIMRLFLSIIAVNIKRFQNFSLCRRRLKFLLPAAYLLYLLGVILIHNYIAIPENKSIEFFSVSIALQFLTASLK